MHVIVENISNSIDDHLTLEDTSVGDYIDNAVCDNCEIEMKPISIIQNAKGEIGLTTGLCKQCGYIKRIRNLTAAAFEFHFSNKWLIQREEELVENSYVFSKLEPYIPEKGLILDIGCGLGGSLLAFHKLGYEVYGVEPSKHRSAKGRKIMENIETGMAEQYLSSSEKYFDVIYFFNVLQFIDNPFAVLEKAVSRLRNEGVIYINVGTFAHKSNYSQFSHLGVTRNFVSLYALKALFDKLGVYPIYYKDAPFEIIISKKKGVNTDKILKSAVKIDEETAVKYAKKTLKLIRLNILGKVTLFYNGRKTVLRLKRPMGEILPVIFEHDSDQIPILLK